MHIYSLAHFHPISFHLPFISSFATPPQLPPCLFHCLPYSLKNDSFFIKMHELLQNIIRSGIVEKDFGESMSARLCHKKRNTQRVEEIEGGNVR